MFKLFRYFSITCLLALVCVTILITLIYRNNAERELVSISEIQNITITRTIGNVVWPSFAKNVKKALYTNIESFRNSDEIKKLYSDLEAAVAGIPGLQIKIYTRDGITIFSSDYKQIGEDRSQDTSFKATIKIKQPVSKLARKTEMVTFAKEVFKRDVVETYVPMVNSRNELEGVFEIYLDVSDLTERISQNQHKLSVILAIVFTGLYLALLLIVRRADSILTIQYDALTDNEEEIHKKNIELTQEISKRGEAENNLQKAHSNLETKVKERTQEILETNVVLKKEIEDRKRIEEKLFIIAKAFENTSEAIVITDAHSKIIDVNQAFSFLSGYQLDEVIGKNPRILKSNRHDADFYNEMWQSLKYTGHWTGEIWNRRKNGEIYPQWLSINAVKDALSNVTHYVGIGSDITKTKATEERLLQLAYYDPLTHLPNRVLFKDRLQQAFSQSARSDKKVALLYIDLDEFKRINDTLGHTAGDELLVDVGKILVSTLRKTDTISRHSDDDSLVTTDSIARLGGDEFTIILPDIEKEEMISIVAKRLHEALSLPLHIQGHEIYVTCSIGIAIYPNDGDNIETLLKNADTAMYQAKEAGRGVSRFFTSEMNTTTVKRMVLDNKLRRALEQNEFILYYQPKVDTTSGEIVSMESLVRWIPPGQDMVPPNDFIPIAEETGLIVPLGRWILETACKENCRWIEKGIGPLRVAVNLSARQFQQKNLVSMVQKTLAKTGMPPHLLELEITESMVMGDVDQAITVLNDLKKMGIYISIDDFGTGYSSLSYLKRLPLHSLKIDQSFIRELHSTSDDAAIVSAIISMADSLGLNVIAEGVETEEQLRFLKDRYCHEIQGYYISPPLPADRFEMLLIEEKLQIIKKVKMS